MENDSPSVNRNLVKELIELRQLKSEKESILRTNQYYIAQVSQMEIKISELKANLQAKNTEIGYLNEKIKEYEEQLQCKPNYNKDLEEDVLLLQAENEHLKLQVQEAGEVSQLKIQLEYALKMKETFEEKYREAKTLLLTNKNVNQGDNYNESEYVKKENYLKLQEELENVKKQSFQLKNQCLILSSENEELSRRFESMDKESTISKEKYESVTPKNQFPLTKGVISPEQIKDASSSSSVDSFGQNRIISKNITLGSAKSTTYFNPQRLNKLNNSRVAKSSLLSMPKPLIKNEVVEYCPSFMRNKKSDLKTTPTPSMKKNSVNSYADEFPEEEEF